MAKMRILVVDDHPLMREALRAAIEDEPDMEVVGEAGDGSEAISKARALNPDVIVIDLFMPGKGGFEAITEILASQPDIRILVLTSVSDEEVALASVRAGALGFVQKDVRRSDLLHAIREVGRGQAFLPPYLINLLVSSVRKNKNQSEQLEVEPLTEREKQVLAWVGQGATNREIAAALFISEGTVRTHLHHVLEKLGLKNRNQALLYALQSGIVPENKTKQTD